MRCETCLKAQSEALKLLLTGFLIYVHQQNLQLMGKLSK